MDTDRGLQVLGEEPGLCCTGPAVTHWVGAVFWGVVVSLPESTLLVGVGAVGLRLLWWCLW
jgi:hypothetical protein